MKCAYCSASTEVLETRTRKDGSVRRLRRCHRLHTFTTEEQPYVAGSGRRPTNGHALRAQGLAMDQRAARIKAELAAGAGASEVARKFGVSLRTVQRIREGSSAP